LKKIFLQVILYVNVASAVILVFSFLSPRISPEKIWFPAFLGLAYPYILLVNVIFMLGWIFLRKKEFLISLLAIILGWGTLTDYFSMHPFKFLKKEHYENLAREQRETNRQLKLVSFNVRAFDLSYRDDHSSSREEILTFSRHEDLDILCIQEFYSFNLSGYRESEFCDKLNHLPYRHIAYLDSKHARGLGIATFSRYPIILTGRIPLEKSNNICIYSNILVDQDTFRIYNCHLQSVNLDSEDYQILDSLKLRYDDQQIAEIKDISFRLRYAFIKRAAQADLVAAHVAACPYPVIICGDFNDTPVSYTYRTIRNGLQDAFAARGWGLGRTYHGEFPSFRIDYILHSQSIETLFFSREKIMVSDHFPIISFLKMK
jgi:endonuclease/exonuclease/phosphatase (EEP) superfamily protein YafD